MKSGSMERDELASYIHGLRFKIMQHYMFMYGDRLDGQPCRYDRYNEGRLIGSTEGEACHKSLLVIHQEEQKLCSMLDRLETLSREIKIQ